MIFLGHDLQFLLTWLNRNAFHLCFVFVTFEWDPRGGEPRRGRDKKVIFKTLSQQKALHFKFQPPHSRLPADNWIPTVLSHRGKRASWWANNWVGRERRRSKLPRDWTDFSSPALERQSVTKNPFLRHILCLCCDDNEFIDLVPNLGRVKEEDPPRNKPLGLYTV